MRMKLLAACAAAVILTPAQAQQQSAPPGDILLAPRITASSLAFQQLGDKLQRELTIRYTGDADIDFFRSMIPHHQGGIDMAKVVLEHGKDLESRKFAAEMIASHEKEIVMIRDWLKKKGY